MPDLFLRTITSALRSTAILVALTAVAPTGATAQAPSLGNNAYGVPLSQGTGYPAAGADRLVQSQPGLEAIRPGLPAVIAIQPSGGQSAGGQPANGSANPAPASPFDSGQFLFPTLGLPPGLRAPEPTPEVRREYGQFVEREIAPENTIYVVMGRAKVVVLRERPARIYIPDENVATVQVVTDKQLTIVGKKPGTTVLNLWFENRSDPLSYLIVALADPELLEAEAKAKAYVQSLKRLEAPNQGCVPRQRRSALARRRESRGPR